MVFVKNLPHGFFEEQLRGFFTQFGTITRLRLGRSKRTLRSRGYAFIEFRYPEVAEIAAEAINNYIMFKRIVKAKFIPPSDIHHDYFKSSVFKIRNEKGEKEFTSTHIIKSKMNVEITNKLMTDDDQKKRLKRIAQKLNKKKKVFADLGIDYDLNNVADKMGVKLKSVEPQTIENLNDTELDDEADETFDPEKFEMDSDDEIENLENSEESEDEAVEELKKQMAIKAAKKVSKEKKVAVEKVEKSLAKKPITRKKTEEKSAATKKVKAVKAVEKKTAGKVVKPVKTKKMKKV